MADALNIAVRPCYADFLQNRLFSPEHAMASHWMSPLVRLKAAVEQRGWQINTWDMVPLEKADVILCQDLPLRSEFDAAKTRAPRAKFILQIWETPLSRPHAWDRRNHDLFDAIITYDRKLVDNKRYFKFSLPLGVPSVQVTPRPFTERKPLVLMNSNRWIGLWSYRARGMAGLPFFGPLFSGWHVSLPALLSQNRGEQYSARRKLVRLADREFPGLMDVYGSGWRGEPSSWVHKFVRHRPFASGKGGFSGDKMELIGSYRFGIASENVVADRGYISEKIFDMLYAGVVPIYIGDEHITEVVPAECFVDARQFKGDNRALLKFAASCDESSWARYRDAGKHFCESSAVSAIQPEAFVHAIIGAIETVSRERISRCR